jgi:hypothetical protein
LGTKVLPSGQRTNHTVWSMVSTSLVHPSYFELYLHSEILLTFHWVYTSFSTWRVTDISELLTEL